MCGTESAYFQNEVDVSGEGLHPVETGDEADGQEALLIHLPAQEEVPLQVVQAEVVLAAEGRETAEHTLSIIVGGQEASECEEGNQEASHREVDKE